MRIRQPRLLVISGPPCTGKTALATALHREIGGVCIDVDRVRQRLIPDSDQSERDRDIAYAAMHLMTAELLQAHVSPVTLAATYTRMEQRRRLADSIAALSADVLIVQCRVDPDVAVARFHDRPSDHAALDLTAGSVRQASAAYRYAPDALVLNTNREMTEIVGEVLRALQQHPETRLAQWCGGAGG